MSTGYYVNPAHQARIRASASSIQTFADWLMGLPITDDEFNPHDWVAMLNNLGAEAGFLRDYIDQGFLTASMASSNE